MGTKIKRCGIYVLCSNGGTINRFAIDRSKGIRRWSWSRFLKENRDSGPYSRRLLRRHVEV